MSQSFVLYFCLSERDVDESVGDDPMELLVQQWISYLSYGYELFSESLLHDCEFLESYVSDLAFLDVVETAILSEVEAEEILEVVWVSFLFQLRWRTLSHTVCDGKGHLGVSSSLLTPGL